MVGGAAGGKVPEIGTGRRRDVASDVIARFGRSYADEAGIALRNAPTPLFQLLCFALLASARIRANIAAQAARELFANGWTTPHKLLDSTWERRAKVLNEAGYARYDERTSTMLADTSRLLVDRWDGDLRRMRAEANRDPTRERELLQEFKGIGPVGADIFSREVQAVWPECYPTVDDRALRAARRLGLGNDPADVSQLVSPSRPPQAGRRTRPPAAGESLRQGR